VAAWLPAWTSTGLCGAAAWQPLAAVQDLAGAGREVLLDLRVVIGQDPSDVLLCLRVVPAGVRDRDEIEQRDVGGVSGLQRHLRGRLGAVRVAGCKVHVGHQMRDIDDRGHVVPVQWVVHQPQIALFTSVRQRRTDDQVQGRLKVDHAGLPTSDPAATQPTEQLRVDEHPLQPVHPDPAAPVGSRQVGPAGPRVVTQPRPHPAQGVTDPRCDLVLVVLLGPEVAPISATDTPAG